MISRSLQRTRHMRQLLACALLLVAPSLSPASVLHWTTRLMGMECDNKPVRLSSTPDLQHHPAQADLDTKEDFTAQRFLAPGTTLKLGLCGGEVHILPNPDPTALKLTVHLTHPLPGDLTPKSYLQELSAGDQGAVMAWKLPENAHPLIYVYVPTQTHLEIQLGKGDLDIAGVEGDKLIHLGKGDATLKLGVDPQYKQMDLHVAMGSFQDHRPGGREDHKKPLHDILTGAGPYTAEIHVAMGRIVLLPA